jgi:sulfatase modifying factor 1
MGAVPGDDEAMDQEKPRHRVKISKGFWLGATPVTVAEYKQFDGSRSGEGDHPVTGVTWEESRAYCEWAGGRLPTEAEWEYAARGGKDGLKYPWGSEITSKNANYGGSERKGTSPVRSYPANDWGLYDMAGNVWEWVADWYDKDYYKSSPTNDPCGPDRETGVRVLRGGAFIYGARGLRASCRDRVRPGVRLSDVGFRCVREVIP